MITPANYFETIKDIDFDNMPPAIRQGHTFVVDLNNEGSWEAYHESDAIKETVDLYFAALQKNFDDSLKKPKETPSKTEKTDAKEKKEPTAKLFIEEGVKPNGKK